MRLGQLARKLDISPTQIINFLSENGIQISEGSNAKLDSQQEEDIIQKFADNRQETPLVENKFQENPSEDTEGNESGITLENPSPPGNNVEDPISEQQNEKASDSEDPGEEMELIKAPKVALPGLKVVGKIDLPQPKETEVEVPGESEDTIKKEDTVPSKDRRRQRDRNKRRSEKPRENPVEARRQSEEKEEIRQKKIQNRRKKDQRRLRYQEQQSKIQAMSGPKSKVAEEVEVQSEEPVEEPIVRRNWFSRLWHMLDAD